MKRRDKWLQNEQQEKNVDELNKIKNDIENVQINTLILNNESLEESYEEKVGITRYNDRYDLCQDYPRDMATCIYV